MSDPMEALYRDHGIYARMDNVPRDQVPFLSPHREWWLAGWDAGDKELEAQVAALQAEVAWLNRPFLGAVPPDPLAPVRQHSVKYVPPRRATFAVDDPLPGVESATARERTKLWLKEVMPDRLNKEVGFGSPDPSLFGYDLDGSKAEAAWRAGRQDSSVVKGFGSPDPAPAPSVETKPTAPPLPAVALKHGV